MDEFELRLECVRMATAALETTKYHSTPAAILAYAHQIHGWVLLGGKP